MSHLCMQTYTSIVFYFSCLQMPATGLINVASRHIQVACYEGPTSPSNPVPPRSPREKLSDSSLISDG